LNFLHNKKIKTKNNTYEDQSSNDYFKKVFEYIFEFSEFKKIFEYVFEYSARVIGYLNIFEYFKKGIRIFRIFKKKVF
jgi:hypothetical protein